MIRVKRLVVGIALLSMPVYFSACATTKPQAQVETAGVARTGDTIQLFYGASQQNRGEFCLDAVVLVYHPDDLYYGYEHKSEVGKIKITKVVGEHYLEAVVVDGTVRDGDFALQTSTACLIKVRGSGKK